MATLVKCPRNLDGSKIDLKLVLMILALFLASAIAMGRPEYAVRLGYSSCVQCHVNPAGGGIRTLNGKLYGFKNQKAPSYSQSELFQADLRSAYFNSLGGTETTSRKGPMIMSSNLAVALPLNVPEAGEGRLIAVASNGFGMLETGVRDSYLLWRAPESKIVGNWIGSVLVGRSKPAFGIMTDEHRAYTRLQSRTTFKAADFETGVQVSGTPFSSLSYDLMLTSGDRGGGGSNPSATTTQGLYANLRHVIWSGRFTLGASYNSEGNQSLPYNLEAYSVFGGTSFERFGLPPVVLMVEMSTAHGWNNSTANAALGRTLGSNVQSAWWSSVADSWSEAYNASINYFLSPRLTLIARAERITPDRDNSGDSFFSYSGGARYYFAPTANLGVYFDDTYSTRPGMNGTAGVAGVEKVIYALLHVWY